MTTIQGLFFLIEEKKEGYMEIDQSIIHSVSNVMVV